MTYGLYFGCLVMAALTAVLMTREARQVRHSPALHADIVSHKKGLLILLLFITCFWGLLAWTGIPMRIPSVVFFTLFSVTCVLLAADCSSIARLAPKRTTP